VQVLLNNYADQPLSSVLTSDTEHLHSFHAVIVRNNTLNFNNDLTVVVSKNTRTVTMSKAADAAIVSPSATVSPIQKDSIDVDVESTIPLADYGEVSGQKPASKGLDTTALAAALPAASSYTSGSAFAGYNFATMFTKSETGQS